MARWAVAAARHFRGRGILWEMYNAPNIGFWKPKPNVDQYAALALEVGRALRAAEPGETYLGPATSTIDSAFRQREQACLKSNLTAEIPRRSSAKRLQCTNKGHPSPAARLRSNRSSRRG